MEIQRRERVVLVTASHGGEECPDTSQVRPCPHTLHLTPYTLHLTGAAVSSPGRQLQGGRLVAGGLEQLQPPPGHDVRGGTEDQTAQLQPGRTAVARPGGVSGQGARPCTE